MTITENDKMTNYIVKLQIKLFLNQFERDKWVEHFTVQCYTGKALIVCFVVPSSGLCINLVIAKQLSVRLIIMQVRWALVGSQSEVVLVCMSVHNGFTIEIYEFTHSLCTFVAHVNHDAIVMEIEVENLEDRKRCQNESRDMKDS